MRSDMVDDSTPRLCNNPHCHAACLHAQSTLEAEQTVWPSGAYCAPHHPFQGAGGWEGQWPRGYDEPPIAAMLVQEANAWNALLQLHGSTAASARTQAEVVKEEGLAYEEHRETAMQREAAYVSSLSQLASSADALATEAIKIRGLRRAKWQLESIAMQEFMRTHSNETLALGDSVARNCAVSVQAATVEMRSATQALRAQITQARALLQEVQKANELRIPTGSTIVIGLRDAEESVQLVTVEDLLSAAFAVNGKLDDESLSSALAGARLQQTAVRTGRTFARRVGSSGQKEPSEEPAPAPVQGAEESTAPSP